MEEGLHWSIYWVGTGSSYLTSDKAVLFVFVNVLMPESSSLSSPLQLSVKWKTQFGECHTLKFCSYSVHSVENIISCPQ